MSKKALQAVIDQRPAVRNGELVHAATVVQVSQLALAGPYRGDFQIIDQGRLIVGEHPDLGERVVAGSYGMFGYDPSGVNTFAVVSRQYGPFGAGDVFAGYTSGNYLLFDQSEGTLGVYSPAGAGFIAAADGSLYAGDTDAAHMRWNTATRAIEVRNGEDVKISLDANGDASFDGTVYASGGRIYGQMQVDGLFRAGDVDGPSISLGRFERTNDLSELVESSEIIATDANNLPWFHVVAGGGTAAGGYFYLGNPGDYQQRLIYDGTRLALDGDIYARGGELGDLTLTGDLTITTGSLTMDTVTIDNSGITFDAILGKYDGGGLRWLKQSDSTERFRIGTMVDLGDVTGVVVESQLDDLAITAPNVYIQPIGGVVTFGAPDGGYGEVSSSYTTISETGSITTVGTATATFANGIIGPTWKPASDSTTALQLQNAAGTAVLTVDTSNKRIGIGKSPTVLFDLVGSSSNHVAAYLNKNDDINWAGIYYGFAMADGSSEFGLTFGAYNAGGSKIIRLLASGSPSELRFDAGSDGVLTFEHQFEAKGGLIGKYHTDLDIVLNYHTIGGADTGIKFKTNGGSNTAMAIMETGKVGIGTTSPDSNLHVHLDDAATNAASQLLTLSHNTSGTVANGFGSRVLWELESSTSEDQSAAALDVTWTNKDYATRTSKIVLSGTRSGALYELAAFSGAEGVVLNDTGESWADFRVEGDTSGYVLFVDASADAVGIGTQTPATRLHVQLTDARTNDRANMLTLEHNTTGTPTKGFASGVLFQLESDTTTSQDAALIEASWDVATHASRAGVVSLYGSYTGTMYKGLSVGAVSGAAALSFYGVPMIAQPTTSHAAASFTANSGTAVNDASTFDGYTLKQVVKALRDLGALT